MKVTFLDAAEGEKRITVFVVHNNAQWQCHIYRLIDNTFLIQVGNKEKVVEENVTGVQVEEYIREMINEISKESN